MTLIEYIEEQQKIILEFRKWWEINHTLEPQYYPLVLSPGGWDDMLASYIATVRKHN